MFRLKLYISVNISVNSRRKYHKPLQTMTQTTTNDDMNHHKSQITTNHHKPWHKPPWTMTETSTKHDMNHYKSPQTMTWTIMMTQKELCIKPYGFLVIILTSQLNKLPFRKHQHGQLSAHTKKDWKSIAFSKDPFHCLWNPLHGHCCKVSPVMINRHMTRS